MKKGLLVVVLAFVLFVVFLLTGAVMRERETCAEGNFPGVEYRIVDGLCLGRVVGTSEWMPINQLPLVSAYYAAQD